MNSPAFPQTSEGVTDWEKVFEDPDQGLISVIRQANSHEALSNCMMVIIKQLFTRKGDELHVAQLTQQVDALVAQPDGPLAIDAAIGMLRLIKEQRQEKARAYLADKKKKKRKKNRRTTADSAKSRNLIYLFFKNPKYLVGICVVLLVALGGVIAALVLGGNKGDVVVEEEYVYGQQDGVEPETTFGASTMADGKPSPLAPSDMPLADFAKGGPLKSSALVLRHVSLPRSLGKFRRGPTHVMPFILLNDKDETRAVCKQLPYILSTLNVELSKAFKDIDVFDERILAHVGRRVAIALNGRLEDPSVMRIHLAIPQNNRDVAPGKCSTAPESLGKYLQ